MGCANCCFVTALIALLVLGCCAAEGSLSPVEAGGAFIALAAPIAITYVLRICYKDPLEPVRSSPRSQKWNQDSAIKAAITTMIVAIGALGVAGIMNETLMGGAVLGGLGMIIIVDIVVQCHAPRQQRRRRANPFSVEEE